jgi:hypothetical protein
MGNLGYCKPGLEASEHPTVQDICWAAGIYEGEGSCFSWEGSLHINISQKDKWLCKRLKILFGGSIGKDHGLDKWHISGARARGFAMTIYKFLSPRRKEQIRRHICLNH